MPTANEKETTVTSEPSSPPLPPVPPELARVVVPLSRCPRCAYSLAGLPAKYQCPECGETYDETMLEIVTGQARSTIVVMVIICGACLLAALVTMWVAAITTSNKPVPLFLVFYVIAIGSSAATIARKRPSRCIVSPQGVRIITQAQSPLIPWAKADTLNAVRTVTGGSQLRVGSHLLGKAFQTGVGTMIVATRAECKALNQWLAACLDQCAKMTLDSEAVL